MEAQRKTHPKATGGTHGDPMGSPTGEDTTTCAQSQDIPESVTLPGTATKSYHTDNFKHCKFLIFSFGL